VHGKDATAQQFDITGLKLMMGLELALITNPGQTGQSSKHQAYRNPRAANMRPGLEPGKSQSEILHPPLNGIHSIDKQ
jgi:hypothetical protein